MGKKTDNLMDGIMSFVSSKDDDTSKEPIGTKKQASKQSTFNNRKAVVREGKKSDREKKSQMRIHRRVEPTTCKMWDHHNRKYELLTEQRCKDLIEGFEAQGQQIPAIVRELPAEDEFTYEVISGARRHWTSSFLGKELLIEVRDLDDEAAFLLSDAENRQRDDISDYERALDYQVARELYYKNRAQLATALNMKPSTLDEYFALASMPKEVISAYRSVVEMKRSHAVTLKALLAKRDAKAAIIKKAKELANSDLEGKKVFSALRAAHKKEEKRGGLLVDETYTAGNKKPVFQITKSARGGYVIKLEKKMAVDRATLESLLSEALKTHVFAE